jgi:electron transfer flavoprotein alpha/beta subunit
MSPIPWAAILTHGPAIVSAASRLLATASASESRNRHETIEARLDQLEKASMESARLLQEIAQQVQALTIAQEQTARRAAIAMALGAAAAVVGIGAGVLAVI